MKRVRKRCITLIEILIVVALIGIIGGMASLGIRNALLTQRFKTEVAQVVRTLRVVQDVMLILNTDIHVKFSAGNDGITTQIELDDKLSDYWHKELTKPRPLLKEIRVINFGTGSIIDLEFLSGGAVMSQGVMRLGIAPPNTPNTLEAFICLPGFPHFIESTPYENEDPACNFDQQKKYNQALTQLTVSEIKEKSRLFKDDEKDEKDEENKKDEQKTPQKKT